MMDSALDSNQPFNEFEEVSEVLSQIMLVHGNCVKSQLKGVFGPFELPHVLFT